MTEVNLQEFARQQGIRKSIQKMKEQEKVMLRYQYVLSKTKNAQGDFERTNQGAANQMRMFTENLKELGRVFGEVILPYANKALQVINGWLVRFQKLSPQTKNLIIGFSAFAAIIPPLIITVGSLATALAGLGAAFTFLSAHPFILTIAGIVAGLKLMYHWAQKIGEAFGRLVAYWDRISNANGVWETTKALFGVATGDEKYVGSNYQDSKRNISRAQATPTPQTTNNNMNMTFNTSATVRQEADVDKIGQTLVNKFSQAYNNMGNYTPIPSF